MNEWGQWLFAGISYLYLLKCAYDMGYCNGNQKGFDECSKIWQRVGTSHEN